jgi:divalent metal cation (Fe/Co/Zn/Cd) transporter
MTQRTFFLIAAAMFSLIALGHAIRLLFGWHVAVENVVVPVWISWIGLAIAGYLAYHGFRLGRRIRSELRVFGK